MSRVLLDTGPLVALFSTREASHAWVLENFSAWTEPCVTCEPVLTEAFHLLAKVHGGCASLRTALRERLIILDFDIRTELSSVLQLMERYEDIPMSLADASLVRMAELSGNAQVFTLDKDFRIYRKNRTGAIAFIAPFA